PLPGVTQGRLSFPQFGAGFQPRAVLRWAASPSGSHHLVSARTPAMVLSSFVRRWMNGKGFASQRGRLPAPSARRRACLHLEALEDRCVPSTVTNLSDHDPGSLRDALATTPAGGTVNFQPGLTGAITLTTGELAITKNL